MKRALAALVVLALTGCARPELLPIPATDLSTVEPAVRTAVAAAHAGLEQVLERDPTRAELANAYGELAMVYHAQDLTVPAEAAYRNASRLAPDDKRWPYLLAHLYADTARLEQAARRFEAVLAIDDTYVPTRIYLGQLYLRMGRLDQAETIFEQALGNEQAQAAALAGLGKVALARGDYQAAVARLEDALRRRPGATRLWHPLAMAHRGLGNMEKVRISLARHDPNGGEPGVPDPIVDLMSAKVVVPSVLIRRGQRYGQEGRFDLAAEAFRAAVASDGDNAEALANLGISLANLGRVEEAQARLQDSLRLDDASAFAHFSLAVIYDRQGLDAEAMAHYRAAIEREPGHVQALVYLGDAKLRAGAAREAAGYYRRALAQLPDSARIAHSLAIALLKMGRYAEARRTLESALAAQPESGDLINSLARLLATAPEAPVRDGARALELAASLFQATRSLAVGQTYAMALAENGRFEEAVKLQQETIIGYQRSGTPVDESFLERNLRSYQKRKPAREGWPATDPVFHPRSPAAALVSPPAS